MLMIRLQRVGRKNDPSFRVVLTDSKNSTKSGKLNEVLGSYNPRVGKPVLQGERILGWVSKGAQLSDTVHNLLVRAGILKKKKKTIVLRKPAEVAAPAAAATPAAAPVAEVAAEATPVVEAAPAEVTA